MKQALSISTFTYPRGDRERERRNRVKTWTPHHTSTELTVTQSVVRPIIKWSKSDTWLDTIVSASLQGEPSVVMKKPNTIPIIRRTKLSNGWQKYTRDLRLYCEARGQNYRCHVGMEEKSHSKYTYKQSQRKIRQYKHIIRHGKPKCICTISNTSHASWSKSPDACR